MIKRKNKIIVSIFILIITVAVFIACSNKKVEPISRTEVWLDTPCKITIYDKAKNESLDKAFQVLKNIQDKMNVNQEDSEVSKINQNAGVAFVKVSDETFYVIKEGKKYGELTNGKFDISIGPIVKLWGINTDHARLPQEKEIKELLPLVNYKDIIINENEKSVMLKNKGMSIDLGGIAKGYAGDIVSKVLKENGIEHAVIDLGGNIVVLGSKTDGSNWKVGIQNPSSQRGQYFGVIEVANKSVVTSGIYERYFEKDGRIYHHIFDTATGYPVDNNLSAVTIITDKSIAGDALSKVFCMGVEKGRDFINGIEGADAIFVTKNKEVYTTKGIKSSFKITDESFKLMN